jgi:N6-adenosine-specific RNA methylase IME4
MIQSGGILQPGEPRYKGLAAEFASQEFADMLAGHLALEHKFKFIHPLANYLPMIPEDQRPPFRASLAERQNRPVLFHHAMLADGRNRVRELLELRRPISYAVFNGTLAQLFDFLDDENFKRRHLTFQQRVDYAARRAKIPRGVNRYTLGSSRELSRTSSLPFADQPVEPASTEPPMTHDEAAERYDVSVASIKRYSTVLDQGAPELQHAFRQGDVTVNDAASIAALPVTEQKPILDALPRDEAGKLTPDAKKEIRKVAKEVRAEDQAEKKKKRDDKEAKLGTAIAAKGKFGVVLEDFEWDFEPRSRETGMDRHPSNHYPTARDAHTAEEIVARTAERFACADDDCVLYMWTTIPHCAIAMKVMELRGFDYKSQRCWDKVRNGDGRGPGFWVTGEHELLLIGTRGKVTAPSTAHFPSRFEAPVGKHSEKPDQQYEHAEFHFPNTPKIELNARRAREGWIRWGNEAPEVEQPALGLEPAEAAE